jgi:hypothetical protein
LLKREEGLLNLEREGRETSGKIKCLTPDKKTKQMNVK